MVACHTIDLPNEAANLARFPLLDRFLEGKDVLTAVCPPRLVENQDGSLAVSGSYNHHI